MFANVGVGNKVGVALGNGVDVGPEVAVGGNGWNGVFVGEPFSPIKVTVF